MNNLWTERKRVIMTTKSLYFASNTTGCNCFIQQAKWKYAKCSKEKLIKYLLNFKQPVGQKERSAAVRSGNLIKFILNLKWIPIINPKGRCFNWKHFRLTMTMEVKSHVSSLLLLSCWSPYHHHTTAHRSHRSSLLSDHTASHSECTARRCYTKTRCWDKRFF